MITSKTLIILSTVLLIETKDVAFDIEDRIIADGYDFEKHEILTADDYYLAMHRISSPSKKHKGPILMQHGMFGSPDNFLYNGPDNSIAYMLSDIGFDVWMGTFRGNMYSRKHKTLDPDKDNDFWNYSIHEHGIYDLPAFINYILSITNNTSLKYIGHSMGCTSFFIMISEMPTFNSKIKSAHLLAPVSYFKHIRSPIYTTLCPLVGSGMLTFRNFFEIFPHTPHFKKYSSVWCSSYSQIEYLCKGLSYALSGPSSFMNSSLLADVFATYPNGGSFKEIIHYCQLQQSGTFRQFDVGEIDNIKKYGYSTPPNYILENIKVPLFLYYSKSDYICDPRDVERLKLRLKTVVFEKYYKEGDFNHADFLLSKNVQHKVNKLIIENVLK